MAYIAVFTFFILLIPVLIALGIAYGTSKKLFPLMYIISVFSYICTVTYVIDAYQLGKNGIIIILAVSAVLMMALGFFIAHTGKKK